MVDRVIPDEESGELSICDITPTILDYFMKRGYTGLGNIKGGTIDGKIEFQNILTIADPFKEFAGQPLTEIIEGRLSMALQDFERIIVVVIDGLTMKEFFTSGKQFYRKVRPMPGVANSVFPSMTTTAMTSLFTGVFPFLHGVTSDKFYDCNLDELTYIKPRSTAEARYRYPFSLDVATYAMDPVTEGNYKVSMVCAGVSHNNRLGSNFIRDFFGEEFRVMGDYVEEKTNKMAFERSRELLNKYRKNNSNFILFIRFSVDWLVHKFGIGSPQSTRELEDILNFVTALTKEANVLWPGKKSLFLMISDHGLKPTSGGLVTLEEIKKMLGGDYQFIVSNQSSLHLYHEWYRALVLKSKRHPIGAYIKKRGSKFFALDTDGEKWVKVKTFSPNKIPTFSLSPDRFGAGYTIGEFLLIADNFYFGTKSRSKYPKEYLNLNGIHGGLSPFEIYVPLIYWSS